MTPSWISEYETLLNGAALVDFSDRTQVEISGEDRAAFLHNLSTNEIRKLLVGEGCEAFLTSVQGKTLAHVVVFSGPASLVLETTPGQAHTIIRHLDHYLVRERVVLEDRSGQWAEVFLGGQGSAQLLASASEGPVPQNCWQSLESRLAGREVWLRRVDFTAADGFIVDCRRSDLATVAQSLRDAGAISAGQEAFNAARIEHGWPFFGQDISEANLPQEVAREGRTISFVKGCYLGQETVARIDALGHVNKTLAAVRFAGAPIPEPGCELTSEAQSAGRVTSATFSPRLAAPLALAYLRRGMHQPGTRLDSPLGPAEVVGLPVR